MSLDRLVLHDQTRTQLEQYIRQPVHALLLIGSGGAGKHSLVQALAHAILSSQNEVHYKTIEPEKDKSSIGIETVRELQQFTKLKLANESDRRLIHISDAHLLTTEAQNALLKMIEEPSRGTHFILTAVNEQQLLPTIRSRSQHITIHRPDRQAIEKHFAAQGHDTKDTAQAYSLSGGQPGLMNALLSDTDHPLRQSAQVARQLLQMSQFERLCQVDALAKNKDETLQLIAILQLMARAALEQIALQAAQRSDQKSDQKSGDNKPLKQWHKILRASYEAEQAYARSTQAKLTLTNLMLAL